MEDIKKINIEDKEDITDEEIAISNLVNDLLFNIDTEDVPIDTFWTNIVVKLGEVNLNYDNVIHINDELSYIIIGCTVLKVMAGTYEDYDETYGSFEIEESSKEEVLNEIHKKRTNLHLEIDKLDNIETVLTSN